MEQEIKIFTYDYCGNCSSLSRDMRIEVQYNDISGHQEALKVSDIATELLKFEENRSNILIVKPQNTKALRIYCLKKKIKKKIKNFKPAERKKPTLTMSQHLHLSNCCVWSHQSRLILYISEFVE